MTTDFISASCEGELCSVCQRPSSHKVEETIFHDDLDPLRHPYTAYVCSAHFRLIMEPKELQPRAGAKTKKVKVLSDVLICTSRVSRYCVISEAFDKGSRNWGGSWRIHEGGAVCKRCFRNGDN